MRQQTPIAIASESPATVEAGRLVAAMDGNAVDVAVGAALAATVSEALMCSLGGSDAMPDVPEKPISSIRRRAGKHFSLTVVRPSDRANFTNHHIWTRVWN